MNSTAESLAGELAAVESLANEHRYWPAIERGRALAARFPNHAALHTLLGRCLLAAGDGRAAFSHLQRALALSTNDHDALRWFGDCLARAGQYSRALHAYDAALKLMPKHAGALIGKAMLLIGQRRFAEAARLIESAAHLAPDDMDLARGRRLLNTGQVPRWHFPMVNEVRRNAAFAAAINAAVRSGDLVLDIGTGSGLMSMLAARAGAKRVVACEVNRPLADIAREIIARNGFAERIEIIAKASQQLDPKIDLPRPADVLIAEVLDSSVIGEGALDTIEHARHHLLAPKARIIPAGARISAALAESLPLWEQGGVGAVMGFDLSPLNRFQPELIGIEDRRYPLQRLSDDVELIAFDFTGSEPPTPHHLPRTMVATRSGTAHAVVYWMSVDLDRQTTLDNRPDFGDGGNEAPYEHWGAFARIINPPRPVKAGDCLEISVQHNRQFLEVRIV